jgi:hypothetical protein
MLQQIIAWLYNLLFCGYQHIRSDDDLLRIIIIEILVDGYPKRRAAMALIDTGCPIDLMSGSLATEFGIKFSTWKGEIVLDTLGKGTFKSVGKVSGRWAAGKHFDPKFYDGTWHVSENVESWDVIIGRNTIKKYGLFKVKRELAAPASHRSAPPSLDSMFTLIAATYGSLTN